MTPEFRAYLDKQRDDAKSRKEKVFDELRRLYKDRPFISAEFKKVCRQFKTDSRIERYDGLIRRLGFIADGKKRKNARFWYTLEGQEYLLDQVTPEIVKRESDWENEHGEITVESQLFGDELERFQLIQRLRRCNYSQRATTRILEGMWGDGTVPKPEDFRQYRTRRNNNGDDIFHE